MSATTAPNCAAHAQARVPSTWRASPTLAPRQLLSTWPAQLSLARLDGTLKEPRLLRIATSLLDSENDLRPNVAIDRIQGNFPHDAQNLCDRIAQIRSFVPPVVTMITRTMLLSNRWKPRDDFYIRGIRRAIERALENYPSRLLRRSIANVSGVFRPELFSAMSQVDSRLKRLITVILRSICHSHGLCNQRPRVNALFDVSTRKDLWRIQIAIKYQRCLLRHQQCSPTRIIHALTLIRDQTRRSLPFAVIPWIQSDRENVRAEMFDERTESYTHAPAPAMKLMRFSVVSKKGDASKRVAKWTRECNVSVLECKGRVDMCTLQAMSAWM